MLYYHKQPSIHILFVYCILELYFGYLPGLLLQVAFFIALYSNDFGQNAVGFLPALISTTSEFYATCGQTVRFQGYYFLGNFIRGGNYDLWPKT